MIEARGRATLGNFFLDVEFTVPSRGVTALFGRSGSGKTTVLRWMAGLSGQTKGFLKIGEDVWQNSARNVFVPAHRRAVGYVPQSGGFFPHLSVRDNLMYGVKRVPESERKRNFDEVVNLLNVKALLARSTVDLSGGEKQRVSIARSLLANPRILLLDEPLAAMDAGAKEEILPYLEKLKFEPDLPVFYVSHALDEVARLADQILQIADGGIIASGKTDEVLESLMPTPPEPWLISFKGSSAQERVALLEGTLQALQSKGMKAAPVDSRHFVFCHGGKTRSVLFTLEPTSAQQCFGDSLEAAAFIERRLSRETTSS